MANAKRIAADIENVQSPDPVDGINAPLPEGSNVELTFETFREKARDAGRKKADGDDSLAAFGVECVTGGKLGKIDPRTKSERVKDKLADTTDQIETLFSDYAQAKGLKAAHERSDLASRTTELRAMVKLGMIKTPGFDPVAFIAEVVSSYKATIEPIKDKAEKAKYQPALKAYYRAANAQLETPTVEIDSAKLAEAFRKPAPKPSNAAKEWTKLAETAKKLTTDGIKMSDGKIIVDHSDAAKEIAASLAVYAADATADELIAANEKAAADLRFERDAARAARAANTANAAA